MTTPKTNERVLLALLAAIQFTNIVDFMIMMPMGDILQKSLHIQPARYGWLVSSYGMAAGLTALLGVFYLDNLDRKKALLMAYLGFMAGTIASATIPTTNNQELNYWLFIGTRVLTGFTGGLLGGLVLSIIGDVIPLERRGRAMAVVTISFSLASILGVPIALTLVDATGNNWHIPFYFVSCISLPVWLLAFRFIPAFKSHLTNRKTAYSRTHTFRAIFRSVEQRNALLFTILLVLGQFTTVSLLTPYLINNVGVAQSDIKFVYLTGGACTVLAGFAIGRMVDRIGRFRVFTVFAFLSIVPIWLNTHLQPVPLWVVLSIAGMFFVFITGRMIPANTIASSVVQPEHRAGFMSLNSAAMSLGSGASSALAGNLVSQKNGIGPISGYQYVGYVAIAATFFSLLIVRRLRSISAG